MWLHVAPNVRPQTRKFSDFLGPTPVYSTLWTRVARLRSANDHFYGGSAIDQDARRSDSSSVRILVYIALGSTAYVY